MAEGNSPTVHDLGQVDVLVCGGGPSGVAAAVQAARDKTPPRLVAPADIRKALGLGS